MADNPIQTSNVIPLGNLKKLQSSSQNEVPAALDSTVGVLTLPPLPPGSAAKCLLPGHEEDLQELNIAANSAFQAGYYFFLHRPTFIVKDWYVNDTGELVLKLDYALQWDLEKLDEKRIVIVDSKALEHARGDQST